MSSKTSILLQAFTGTNKTVPVWFMRQAGRYLPAYRKIKEKHRLEEMFGNPDLAAKITCLPLKSLEVDALILFADILTLPSRMGFKITFSDQLGPVIASPIQKESDLKKIHNFDNLDSVSQTIHKIKQQIPDHLPLIGFAGAPFTVLCYLIEGGSSIHFNKTFRFLYTKPSSFHKMMTILTENTIRYLKLQQQAGIQVFQLFDTWAGILKASDYQNFILPYVQKIFTQVKLPSIYYLRGSQHLLALMEKSEAHFLSLCHEVVLGQDPILEKTRLGVQGNLFNLLLYADKRMLKQELQKVLQGARHHQKYIFNLSHGVLPDTSVEKLKFLIEQVHQFPWTNSA